MKSILFKTPSNKYLVYFVTKINALYGIFLIDFSLRCVSYSLRCSCTIDWTMAEARQEEISAEDAEDALRINPFLAAHKVKTLKAE